MELRHTGVVFIDGGHPGAPSDCAPHGLEARTRDRVSPAISEHGPDHRRRPRPASRADPGRRTPPPRRPGGAGGDRGARAGDVRAPPRPSRHGPTCSPRPATRAMTSDYDDLATSALRFLADRAGEDAVAAFARERVALLEERYADALDAAGEDPAGPRRRPGARAGRRRLRGLGPAGRPGNTAGRRAAVPGALPRAARRRRVPAVLRRRDRRVLPPARRARPAPGHARPRRARVHHLHPDPCRPARSTTPPPTSDERASQ